MRSPSFSDPITREHTESIQFSKESGKLLINSSIFITDLAPLNAPFGGSLTRPHGVELPSELPASAGSVPL